MNRSRMMDDWRPRFWAKVNKSGPVPAFDPTLGECWLWIAAIRDSRRGYGCFEYGNVLRMAHRVSYELEVGPIPAGLTIDHLCRVRHCVRPSHLEAVSTAENNRRGFGVIGINVRKKQCKRGHKLSGRNLWTYTDKYGVSHRTCRACQIERVRAWRRRKDNEQIVAHSG